MDLNNISSVLSNNKISDFTTEKKTGSLEFGKILNDAINEVNDNQLYADEMDRLMVAGEVDNVHEVMIAAQKAELTLNLAIEIKSKLMDAYKEIMRLQL